MTSPSSLGKLTARATLAAIILAAAVVSLAAGSGRVQAQAPTTLGRTHWQMLRIPAVIPIQPASPAYAHGDVRLYDFAPPVPASNDSGWVPAPDGQTINFGHGNFSRIDDAGYGCFGAVDFTFFQTLVDVPAGTTLTTFTISFSDMDDGSRITIFNSANPDGLVIPGSYVFLGGAGTANLAEHVVAGETNRVVITQVDDCPSGNRLGVAQVVLNGETVVSNAAPVITAETPTRLFYTRRLWTVRLATFTDETNDSHLGTIDWGDGSEAEPIVFNQQLGRVVQAAHAYADPGTYTVTVQITDNHGATGEGTYEAIVRPHPRLRR